jgi:rare lipoprotein A
LIFAALVGFTIVVSEEETNTDTSVDNEIISVEAEANSADLSLVNYKEMGSLKASWYGPGFHGKRTANGEIYDQMSFTAAHKSLKFGTLLKITNQRNGKFAVVRINDRGPYIEGRDLDISKAAAIQLGLMRRGVARLKVEEIKIAGLDNLVMVN